MKVVGYIRVSTEEQARDGVSLATQEKKIRAYCDLYELDLVTIITDAGASGKNLDRPGLQKALGIVKNGAGGLVVAKLDRLTRSVRDMDTLISDYFNERDRRQLFSVADQVDTRTAAGRLVLNVLMSVAQWERETIGERTREALAHKRSKGERVSRRPPYGWSIDASGCLVPCEPERKAIEIAAKLHLQGWSLRRIGKALSDYHGIYQRNGRPWSASGVQSLLKASENLSDGPESI